MPIGINELLVVIVLWYKLVPVVSKIIPFKYTSCSFVFLCLFVPLHFRISIGLSPLTYDRLFASIQIFIILEFPHGLATIFCQTSLA